MLIGVVCFRCKKQFFRERKEVTRIERLGHRIFCSRSCSSVAQGRPGSIENLRGHSGQRKPDRFSPFREHMKLAIRRSKECGKELSLSLEDLEAQWIKQSGICPYTGWVLINPPTVVWGGTRSIRRASLDRIDSKRGYTPDNIQFVSMMANFAKNNFSEKEFLDFCCAVASHRPAVISP